MLELYYLNATDGHASPVYAVQMPTEDKGTTSGFLLVEYHISLSLFLSLSLSLSVSSYLLNMSISSYDGHNFSITRGFLVNETINIFICLKFYLILVTLFLLLALCTPPLFFLPLFSSSHRILRWLVVFRSVSI